MKNLLRCWRAPLLVAAILPLAACHTPQAALDTANNSAVLMLSFNTQLQEFQQSQQVVQKRRLDAIGRLQSAMSTYATQSAFDDRINQAAGNNANTALATKLRSLGDSIDKDRSDQAARDAANTSDLGALLVPLPDNQKMIEAQKAIAVMGAEMSLKERLSMTATFSKTIIDSVRDNKRKIDDAKNDTPGEVIPPTAPPSTN